MKRTSVLAVAVALAAFGLAACGDDDDGGDDTTAAETTTTDTGAAAGGGGGETLALSTGADAGLAYDTDALTAAAGSVTIDYTNDASVPHDVVIEDSSGGELGKTDLVSGGETGNTTVDLAPGEYTFFCDVSGHREGGMEGTLTVN